MTKLIVNADDFGISESVNLGIVEACVEGIVTSTTIMANGNAFENAIKLHKERPDLDIGVHICLVGEEPLSNTASVPSLVDNRGFLLGSAQLFVKKYFRKQLNPSELEAEIEAQIKRVVDTGITVSHIDGHQHLHMLPGVLRIVLRLAKKYNIRAMRIPGESIRSSILNWRGKEMRLVEQLILNTFCLMAKKTIDVKTPDHFFGFFFGGQMNKLNLLAALKRIPVNGVSELMCHPGQSDDNGQYKHWNYNWEDELSALKDSEVIGFLRERNIELTTYRKVFGT